MAPESLVDAETPQTHSGHEVRGTRIFLVAQSLVTAVAFLVLGVVKLLH
jgi:hypothetical protein